jgi:hypothetical protein
MALHHFEEKGLVFEPLQNLVNYGAVKGQIYRIAVWGGDKEVVHVDVDKVRVGV